jgi:hypothetical protein
MSVGVTPIKKKCFNWVFSFNKIDEMLSKIVVDLINEGCPSYTAFLDFAV